MRRGGIENSLRWLLAIPSIETTGRRARLIDHVSQPAPSVSSARWPIEAAAKLPTQLIISYAATGYVKRPAKFQNCL